MAELSGPGEAQLGNYQLEEFYGFLKEGLAPVIFKRVLKNEVDSWLKGGVSRPAQGWLCDQEITFRMEFQACGREKEYCLFFLSFPGRLRPSILRESPRRLCLHILNSLSSRLR